jgi:peroxiredoxin
MPAQRKQAAFSPPKYLADVDGKPLQLNTEENKTLIVYHFATWCESYLQETDPARVRQCREFREGIDRLSQQANIRLVGFATRYSSDKKSVLRYREQHHIDHPLVFDEAGTFAEQFGARDFPHLVVLRNNSIAQHRDRIDAALIEQLKH